MAQLAPHDGSGHAVSPDSATGTGGDLASANDQASMHTPRKAGKTQPVTSTDMVSASLRLAYEATLDEDIPDIFMDLLRKLD
jgi:Anti-sigma factor NepR